MTVVELCEIASFQCGGTPSKANASYWLGDIPWVSPKDMGADQIVDAEDHISQDAINSSAARLVPAGTLLVVNRSGILVRRVPIAQASRPVSFNQDIKAILVDCSRAIPSYVQWFLKSREHYLLSHGVKLGATVHSLQSGFLESLKLRLPPLDEQRQIVDLLTRAASIRQLAEEAEARARDLPAALFVDMFGDPATNSMGLPTVRIGDIVRRFVGGKNLMSGDDGTAHLRILKISAVTSGIFRPLESKPAPTGYMPPQEHFVRTGDILFSRANTVDLVGATAKVAGPVEGLLLPDKLWRIEVNPDGAVTPDYLFHYLRQPAVRAAMSRLATGTSDSMRNISQGRLNELPVLVPERALQVEYVARITEIDSISSNAANARATADALTNSLLAELFAD